MTDLEERVLCTESYGSRRTRRYHLLAGGSLSCVPERPEDGGCHSLWDFFMAFASSITGTLATQAVLKGVGVGDETSTVTAATVTWILKDGTGMLGRILFAWSKGSKLDCDAKQWSGFFKCIVGVAGGATRAALTMHQARRDNMADVSAKDGSQAPSTDNLRLTYSLYGLFTILHLYANYRAVRAVCMDTLNRARLYLVFWHFLQQGKVLGPDVANPQEPLLLGFRQQLKLTLGAPLHTVTSSVAEFQRALEENSTNYLIFFNQAAESKNKDCAVVSETHRILDRIFPRFLTGLTATGWVTERNLLGPEEWRVDWTISGKKMF
ncbi:hypothetical protein JD844_001311 [Phrynosoma platyrhinos]|uniref:Uncharacterized protein n=1 Tax=Phrynosoma platyrhinos TaxID=52577 RepID=A0ABQ7T9G9_PHRPL|nr:hypothetical protein JD844_001311 [Phrynosoma platyrhinos]